MKSEKLWKILPTFFSCDEDDLLRDMGRSEHLGDKA
jgi:hypothetical protein